MSFGETKIRNKAEEFVGKSYKNQKDLEFTIVEYLSNNQVTVLFKNTGSTRVVAMGNVRAGKVKDYYAENVYGKGYDGNINKSLPYWRKAKQLWMNVMKRCYSEEDDKGYFGKTTVSKRWLDFSLFLEDIQTLTNFELWLDGGMELDKDICGDGTVYSKEVCMFVTGKENRQAQPNYRLTKSFDKITRTWN